VVKPPRYGKPFKLLCDASHTSLGVVLEQYDAGVSNVIHYESKSLKDAQKIYPMG
jgi:hypothetical protein